MNALFERIARAATKYDVLGVSPGATQEELRVAFRRMALLCHPDRQPEADRAAAHAAFVAVADAFETLRVPEERQRYDRALASGQPFEERSRSADALSSLASILSDLQSYEHMFGEDELGKLDVVLRKGVDELLHEDLGEQVIGVYGLTRAPEGAKFRGGFRGGAMVLTTLQLMFPFKSQWEETSGSTKTKYTQLSLPAFPLPLVRRILILRTGRMSPRMSVAIEATGAATRLSLSEANITKLIVVASLWGIPMESGALENATAELRSALLRPVLLSWVLCSLMVLLFAMGGCIDDKGFASSGVRAIRHFNTLGLWQGVVLLTSMAIAQRCWLWLRCFRGERLESKMGSISGGDLAPLSSG